MKQFIAVSWLFVLSLIALPPASAQQSTAAQATSTAQSKIDPAKEADIRRLLEVSGAKNLMMQTMQDMEKTIKPMMTNALPPGEYREKLVDLFFNKFQSKMNMQELVDMLIPIYDKYFSAEEVKGLVKFYETPLGQKSISALPKMMVELQEVGRNWGENLGRQSMQEVLAEHPDLAQALQTAGEKQQ